eukprot:COSAG06_NODE_8706_length_2092_cov_0.996989_3_plen_84_part_00
MASIILEASTSPRLPQSSNSEVAERTELLLLLLLLLLLEVTTRPLVRREAEASCLAAEMTGREVEEEARPVPGLAWACVGGCP